MSFSSLQEALCMKPRSWVSCYWLIAVMRRAWPVNWRADLGDAIPCLLHQSMLTLSFKNILQHSGSFGNISARLSTLCILYCALCRCGDVSLKSVALCRSKIQQCVQKTACVGSAGSSKMNRENEASISEAFAVYQELLRLYAGSAQFS